MKRWVPCRSCAGTLLACMWLLFACTAPALPRAGTSTSPTSAVPAAEAQGWTCPLPVAAHWGGSGVGDPELPLWGNGGYHVQHYDLTLDIDTSAGRMAGHALLLAQPDRPLDAFNLDFAGMQVAALTVDGVPARYCMDDSGELTVIPATQLAVARPFTISVVYSGSTYRRKIPRGDIGWESSDGAFFVLGGKGDPSFLYPSNEYANEKATYTVRVTVPKPLSAITIGQLINTSENECTRTFVWDLATPHQYMMLSVDQYPISKDLVGTAGLPIRIDLPPTVDAGSVEVLQTAPQVIDYLVSLFGPFPYDRLGINWVRSPSELGEEGATRVWLNVTSQWELRDRLVHEIAHQWYGSSIYGVRTGDWPLFEGLATYAELLWREHQGESMQDMISIMYVNLPSETTPPALAKLTDFVPGGVVFYQRPAVAFHVLRLRVGDGKFFAILKAFYARHQFGQSGLEDFLRTAEEVSGAHLVEIFQAWFYQEGVPDIPELKLSKGRR